MKKETIAAFERFFAKLGEMLKKMVNRSMITLPAFDLDDGGSQK